MRALAHPLRLRIMELFAEQPRTTKEVASLLGVPATRLYHHVAALERARLLRITETRQKRGTIERWYEATARTMQMPAPGQKRGRQPQASAARRAIALSIVEQSRQELVAAMHRPRGHRPILGRLVVVGSAAEIDRVRRRVSQVLADVQREFGTTSAPKVRPDDERWALTMTFTPILQGVPVKEDAVNAAKRARAAEHSRAPRLSGRRS